MLKAWFCDLVNCVRGASWGSLCGRGVMFCVAVGPVVTARV